MFSILDVATEKTQLNLIQGIEGFDSKKLKHTETQEKNPLPDKDGNYSFIENLLKYKIILHGLKFKFSLFYNFTQLHHTHTHTHTHTLSIKNKTIIYIIVCALGWCSNNC